jgi:leucine dehydrogenase
MFDESNVRRLSIPGWEAVFRAEICPSVVAIIAVHDTARGWALGGCRMSMYDNEMEALTDVLRLSRGMTFKNAVADLPLGGGKSVIICDPRGSGKERETILQEFGKFMAWVNREKDVYCTAEDMNTTVEDMKVVSRHTKNLCGTIVDPSPYTAWGVFSAIEYSVDYFALDLFEGNRSLAGKKIILQGVGKVGAILVDYLMQAGVKLHVTDINQAACERVKEKYPEITLLSPDTFMEESADVFAPCARGEVITSKNLDSINFKILCGAANNQLQNVKIGKELHARGVVICPDYVCNLGGVCSIQFIEIDKLSKELAMKKIKSTVRKMLGLTFQAAFKNNFAFVEAVDHVVKKIRWGKKEQNDFLNAELFPLTSHGEPHPF